jgi:hypothetical protein
MCNTALEVKSPDMDRDGEISITIEPCETCLKSAREAADEEGYNRGYDEGLEAEE